MSFSITALMLALGGAVAFHPIYSTAGVYSFTRDVYASESQAGAGGAHASQPDAQNVPLLKAPVNSNPAVTAYGGGDIFIVGDSALQSSGRAGVIDQGNLSDKEGRIRVYVVRQGDSLSQIAEMFGVSINTIRWSNDVSKSDSITPGQKLVILPITGIRHTIEEGDTLSSIAEKYSGDLDEIREYNGIAKADTISPGESIIIPDGELNYTAPAKDDHTHTPAPTTQNIAVSGYYAHPASGAIITQRLHGYNAVDFGGSYGSPITAAAPGRVILSRNSGWNGGYGKYIVIEHSNGTETLYSHNSQNIVSVGDWVERGQVIGYMGSTGKSTGNHVHFEVRGAKNPFTICGLRTQCR